MLPSNPVSERHSRERAGIQPEVREILNSRVRGNDGIQPAAAANRYTRDLSLYFAMFSSCFRLPQWRKFFLFQFFRSEQRAFKQTTYNRLRFGSKTVPFSTKAYSFFCSLLTSVIANSVKPKPALLGFGLAVSLLVASLSAGVVNLNTPGGVGALPEESLLVGLGVSMFGLARIARRFFLS